jgi:hypothetical protein
MTRIRNQVVVAIPVKINVIFRKAVFLMNLIHVKILFTIFFIPVDFYGYYKCKVCNNMKIQYKASF